MSRVRLLLRFELLTHEGVREKFDQLNNQIFKHTGDNCDCHINK